MTLTLSPELEAALSRHAAKRGETPETLAIRILEEISSLPALPHIAQDEWEKTLLSIGSRIGAGLTNEQLSRDVIYED